MKSRLIAQRKTEPASKNKKGDACLDAAFMATGGIGRHIVFADLRDPLLKRMRVRKFFLC